MKLLILKEKDGDRYFGFNNNTELHLVALFIVSERIEEGCYEDEQDKRVLTNLTRVVNDDNGKAALAVLQARNNWEYEDFEIVEAETVKGVTL